MGRLRVLLLLIAALTSGCRPENDGEFSLAPGVAASTPPELTGTTGMVAGPDLRAIVPDRGGAGLRITLKGSNFGATDGLPFRVLFDGVAAEGAQRNDDQTITVIVPSEAAKVQVEVNGIISGERSFSLIRRIHIPPQEVLTRQSIPLAVTIEGAANQILLNTVLDWKMDDPEMARLDQDGTLTSLEDRGGNVIVTASSGKVSATASIAIRPRPLSITLTPNRGTLDAQAVGGGADPGFVYKLPIKALVRYSDGSEDEDVIWSSSNPARATVSGGHVISGIDADAGTITVTATARRDGKTSGTATFEVTTNGGAEVIIE